MNTYRLMEDGQILRGEEVVTNVQTAVVEAFHSWGVVLAAAFDQPSSILHVECRRPVIDGTEFQGGLVTTENRNLRISIDGSAPETWPLVGGVASITLEFAAPGTYLITISAEFGCEPATVEVTIP
jgi:hypothetical protein